MTSQPHETRTESTVARDAVVTGHSQAESHRPLLTASAVAEARDSDELIETRRLAAGEFDDSGRGRTCDLLGCSAGPVVVERWRHDDAELGIEYIRTSWLCAYHAHADAQVNFAERRSARRKWRKHERIMRRGLGPLRDFFPG